jgi:hypothetical protein
MTLDQIGQKTGRQDGVADARGGDEQDVHFADPLVLYRGALPLAKKPARA